ncbi:hypothetical protein CVT24_011744 [Panaeolus cyanescens]|uniref:Uncharacterized protein n=1 Tax=Panaeolus cyanescens TaxID=181874 RepID=A0A409YNR1_9AGAR|nr:hypothetical protein CVT24_011744 [Panaeolus cyanescens]
MDTKAINLPPLKVHLDVDEVESGRPRFQPERMPIAIRLIRECWYALYFGRNNAERVGVFICSVIIAILIGLAVMYIGYMVLQSVNTPGFDGPNGFGSEAGSKAGSGLAAAGIQGGAAAFTPTLLLFWTCQRLLIRQRLLELLIFVFAGAMAGLAGSRAGNANPPIMPISVGMRAGALGATILGIGVLLISTVISFIVLVCGGGGNGGSGLDEVSG